jgi:hypothetical protein
MPKDTSRPADTGELKETDAAKDTSVPQLTGKGIRAIQGEPGPIEAPLPDGVHVTSAFPDQAADDGRIHKQARQAAEQALDDKGVTSDRQLDARRHASEAAARITLGGDAINLDQVAQKLGMKGNNFPTYDIASRYHVASVKTHWADDGTLNDAARQAYQRDFDHMLGWGREVNALEQDGQNIVKAREAGVPMPDALRTATPEQAAEYLRNHSVLLVPDDHVETVRADLKARALELPENYFLPSNPTEAQIEGLLQRVQGLGLSSGELRDVIARLEE